jgi:erythromycin esterase
MTTPIKPILVVALFLALSGMTPRDVQAGDLLLSLRMLSQPLQRTDHLDPLLDAVGDARLALLGEASHGTREFYSWRDRLSRRLIRERGFSFIAIEGDWVTLLPLDRYVRHQPGAPASAREALLQVKRWPRWVWANRELEALGEWLRAFNRGRPAGRRVGIHGIDLYAIWESLDAVQAFYQTHLPESAARVRHLYRFLRGFHGDYQAYANYIAHSQHSVRAEVARVTQDLAERYRYAAPEQRNILFEALQHAKVVESGERYLRDMTRPGPHSWNARANHFERSLARLLDHYGPGSRAIVWAHNTHIGDARATDMVRVGEMNLGQLARERHGDEAVFALGFSTATGSVLAARTWEGRGYLLETPRPRPDSLEAALLASGDGDRMLILDPTSAATAVLRRVLPHRAIGVVFAPHRERWANYVPTRLAERYDAFVFLPHTHALNPLHPQ